MSTGRSINITPRVLGRDVMVWFDALGFLRAGKFTTKGRFARAHESFPGWHLRSAAFRRRAVRLLSASWMSSRTPSASATGRERFDVVIWAMGYRDASAWLQIPDAVSPAGLFVENRGVSPAPGLFHVGRSWQTSRASALVCGVAFDAANIVERIKEFIRDSIW